jgi:hypothetical protein
MLNKMLIAVAVAVSLTSSVATPAHCSKCHAVDCSFDTQCGVRCTCVKLNGKIKGQCVEKW